MRMNSSTPNPFLAWAEIGWKMVEISTAANQVVPIRLARLAAAGTNPSAQDRREFHRMGAEKVVAFSRAGAAAARSATPLATRLARQSFEGFSAAWWTWARYATSPAGVLATLKPVHSTVTANARRLSGRRSR